MRVLVFTVRVPSTVDTPPTVSVAVLVRVVPAGTVIEATVAVPLSVASFAPVGVKTAEVAEEIFRVIPLDATSCVASDALTVTGITWTVALLSSEVMVKLTFVVAFIRTYTI
jgi:hypothetical protein